MAHGFNRERVCVDRGAARGSNHHEVEGEKKQYLRGVMCDFRYALLSGLRADRPRASRSFHEQYKGRTAGSMSLGMTDCYSRLRGH